MSSLMYDNRIGYYIKSISQLRKQYMEYMNFFNDNNELPQNHNKMDDITSDLYMLLYE